MRAISRHIYPAYLKYKLKQGKALRLLERYRESQWNDERAIKQIQLKKLRALLRFCVDHVPYYSQIFRRVGLDPNDVTSFEVLKELPILRREDLQERHQDLVPKNLDRESVWRNCSGGSTGKPVVILQDKNYLSNNMATTMRHNEWAGWSFGVKMAKVWGSDRDLAKSHVERIKHRFIRRQIQLNAFEITEPILRDFFQQIRRFRPEVILGYASSLEQVARYVLENRKTIGRIKGVISSAETLFPEQRQIIEAAFRTKVFNRYGSREVGLIASECEQSAGLHVAAETQIVELVPQSDTEYEELIVTNLCNYAMPLIRYGLEDVAIRSRQCCPCGRGLPLLSGIVGRKSDILRFRDGKEIHGEFFTHLFYGERGVKAFRVVQETMEHLVVEIVPMNDLNPNDFERIRKRIQDSCNRLGCHTRVKLVRELTATTPTGKFRFTICELPKEVSSHVKA